MRVADERPLVRGRLVISLQRCIRRLAPLLLLLLAVIITAVPSQPVLAQAAVQMEVTPLYQGNYGRGKWLPLSIVLRNAGSTVDLLLAVSIPNNTFRNTLQVELPGGGEKRVILYAAMDEQTRELRVTAEQSGALLAEQRVDVRPRENERLLALLSSQPLQLDLPLREQLFEQPFLALPLAAADLPDHAAGLASLTIIMLNDLPTSELRAEQQRALWAWVANGGHLVIGGGPGAARTLAGLPGELQPAAIGPAQAIDTTALAEFAAVTPPANVSGVQLSPAPDATFLGRVEAPLWAQRSLGNGRITQLAFDPATAAITNWQGARNLWNRLLQPPLRINLPIGIETSPDYAREQIITSALGNLPAINLPSSGPLFAALALYAILIGPGVALILQRMDRQASGWLVVPLIAGLTALLAMSLAVASRTEQRIVSQISLVEQIGPDLARARTVAALLTPQAGTFRLTVPPEALVRPLRGGAGAFVPIGPAQGDMAQQMSNFPIQVEAWRTEGVIAEQLLNLPALDAQLTISDEAIQAVIRNTTGQPLRDIVVVYGEEAVRIGDLAPDQQGVATWPPPPGPGAERPPIGISAASLILGEELARAQEPGGRTDRQLLIREALLSAATGRGLFEDESGPFVFAWLTRSPLDLTIELPDAATQKTALLVSRPRIAGAGRAFVPTGWLRPDLIAEPRSTCSGSLGRGIAAAPAPVTMTLSLPRAMAGFRADQIKITMESERQWPNAGVQTEVFNWVENNWTALSFDGPGDLALANAGPYLRAGQMRLRLSGRIDEAQCLFIQGQALGELTGP